MDIDILQQHLTDDTCPLCQHHFYEMEANIYGRLYHYFQCANAECQHQVFPQQDRICYCAECRILHKKTLKQSSQDEVKKQKNKIKSEDLITELYQLSFIDKLFLLSVLENHVNEDLKHAEYISWSYLKRFLITPNYYYQKQLMQHCVQQKYLLKSTTASSQNAEENYYINLRLAHDTEPNIYYLTLTLRHLFYDNLTQGIPFSTAEEVKQAIYSLMYQQIIQYCQFICQDWHIMIAGNKYLEKLCYQLLENLALSQIYYLIHRALNYLHQKQLLQTKNDKFINTNLLRKTVQSYYETAMTEKWESYSILFPEQMPISTMSYILFYRFLNLSDDIYYQPIWKIWQKIEPRLKFYERQHYCISCGSNQVIAEYDNTQSITLYCQECQQRNYYFISPR